MPLVCKALIHMLESLRGTKQSINNLSSPFFHFIDLQERLFPRTLSGQAVSRNDAVGFSIKCNFYDETLHSIFR